jgi:hypothetical protein
MKQAPGMRLNCYVAWSNSDKGGMRPQAKRRVSGAQGSRRFLNTAVCILFKTDSTAPAPPLLRQVSCVLQ